MLLITSGAYVESELYAEFGKIPPAFLPVGNRRLYTHQLCQLRALHEHIYLTIPDDFQLDEADRIYLNRHRVEVCRSAPGIALGAAIHRFLDAAGCHGQLDILYGDTLIADATPSGSNWLAVGDTDEYYDWHHDTPGNGQPGGTWTGMFSFADADLLRTRLAGQDDFIAAVGQYGAMARMPVTRWYDFGHVHTYFDSKRTLTTQRYFNQLQVADGVVTKSSSDAGKILAEAAWLEGAPASIKPFLPVFVGRLDGDPPGYQLEYLHLAALNELYVFGRLPPQVWKKIYSACDHYLHAAAAVPLPAPLPPSHLAETYLDKTLQRLRTFAHQTGISLTLPWQLNGAPLPSLLTLAHEAARAVMAKPATAIFLHGDLCFSNILFDFRAGRVKLLDPRGLDAGGRPCAFGDLRYDVGKLVHSVLGLYDFVIAGFFSLSVAGQQIDFDVLAERCGPAQQLFKDTRFCGRTPAEWDCYPVMLLLFFSMLPLHADNPQRQQALMANGMRLYQEWKHDCHTNGRTEPALL